MLKSTKILLILIMAGASALNGTVLEAEENTIPDDLYAAEISLSPSEPTAGEEAIITIKIQNKGAGNLFTSKGLSTYSYEFAGFTQTDYAATFPSLANVINVNGYVYYTFEGSFAKAGSHELSFTVDTGNELAEKDENNNTITRQIIVNTPGAKDLAIEKITLTSNTFVVNTYTTIGLTIKNAGKAYLISAKGFTEGDIRKTLPGFNLTTTNYSGLPTVADPLSPNETFTYNYGGTFTQTGDHNLIFEIDAGRALAETDENNNSSSTAVFVALTQEEADDFSLTGVEAMLISSSSVKIIWETSRTTTGRVAYQKNLYGSEQYESGSTAAKNKHEIILDNLESNTTYKYTIYAVNNTAAKNSSPEKFFTTPADNTINITNGPAVATAGDSATVSWSANLSSGGYVYYRPKNGEEKTAGAETYSWNHKVILSDLDPGAYDFYVISTSTVNTAVRSETYNFVISQNATDEAIPPSADNQTSEATVADNITGAPPSQNTPNKLSVPEIAISNNGLYQKLKGKITLKVESGGEAYYVNPAKKTMHYLGRPEDAFSVMRKQGVGITNNDLNKIPVNLTGLTGADTDGDGLPDGFENSVGTDKNKVDTDGDGYNDKTELKNGYSPTALGGKLPLYGNFSVQQAGKIFLQVENKGEAWYVNPSDNKRYFLGRPNDAFNIMRNLGLGISNKDFDSL